MNYEKHIPRFFNEDGNGNSEPKVSHFKLKSLRRDEEGRPTAEIIENEEPWSFDEARAYTKICVDWTVPDVNERLVGDIKNDLFNNEVPVKNL